MTGKNVSDQTASLHRSGLFEGIFLTAIDSIIAIDERGTIESFNPAAELLFGYPAAEILGRNISELMPSPDREAHDGYLQSYLRSGRGKIIGSGREVVARQKTGTTIPIHLSLSEASVAGRPVFIGICRDIRELVAARRAAEEARERNKAILDTAADGIITINARGIVESFNGAAERLFGYAASDVIGENVSILMPRNIAAEHDGYLSHTLRTGERKVIGIGREVVARRKDLTEFPAFLSVSQFRIKGQDYFTGIIRDISEIREKEAALARVNRELTERTLDTERQLEMTQVARGLTTVQEIIDALLSTVTRQMGALSSTAYLECDTEPGTYQLVAAIALPLERTLGLHCVPGHGLLGQAIRERKIQIVTLPAIQYTLESGHGAITPSELALIPLVVNNEVLGAFELAFHSTIPKPLRRYLQVMADLCADLLAKARDQQRIRGLFSRSQSQMEELKVANEQLDNRAQELGIQQEELELTNQQLAAQQSRLEQLNTEIEQSRRDLELKAIDLERTSRYKSEFLANMSHELRTPLNSILILAKVLLENRDANLTMDQVESVGVIAGSGTDLLNLINDVLDLSKIESGKLQLEPEELPLSSLLEDIRRMFNPLMNHKKLRFACDLHADLPDTIFSDRLRVEQILRNLLANAHKFTLSGSVTLDVFRLPRDRSVKRRELHLEPAVVFEVRDTGIGIRKDKQELVFRAFQQADSTLSRKFGGTGLGLSISNSLAESLGGELQLESIEQVGSTFSLVIPVHHHFNETANTKFTQRARPSSEKGQQRARIAELENQRYELEGNPAVLLVEDDPQAQIALRKLIESRGIEVTVCSNVRDALQVVNRRKFRCVVLDLALGTEHGLLFLEAMRETGKHVPVIVHTGKDLTEAELRELREYSQTVIIKGPRAAERLLDEMRLLLHAAKHPPHPAPISHRDQTFTGRRILIADDDSRNVFALRALLSRFGVQVLTAETGQEALQLFEQNSNLDCVLMDIMMPEMDGFEAIRRMRALNHGSSVPIIALTAKAMKGDRERCLDAGASDYMSKPIENDELLGLMRVWMPGLSQSS